MANNIINTPGNLNGYFKQRYSDELVNLVPTAMHLTRAVPFEQGKRVGDFYNAPVIVSQESGFTYWPSNGNIVPTLAAASAMNTQNAQVRGSAIMLRSQIANTAVTQSIDSEAAFGQVFDSIVKNMYESHSKRLELNLLYGGTGLGLVQSGAAGTSTTYTVTLTDASWSSGIWSGLLNAPLEFWSGANADRGAGTKVSTGVDSVFQLTGITLPAATSTAPTAGGSLTVTGTAAGITALAAAVAGGVASNVNIYFATAGGGTEALGLDYITSQVGSLYNIDNTVYNLFQSNVLDGGGRTLSLPMLQNAVAYATSRGLSEDIECYVSPNSWMTLLNNEVALRRYDGSFSVEELENGAQSIKFFSQNGSISIVPHILLKNGSCFGVPTKRLKRIGSTDIVNSIPSPGYNELFVTVTDRPAYEMRLLSDEALFTTTPAKMFSIKNFSNIRV